MEDNHHLRVKETIRKFNNLYLRCVQEEEKRCAEVKAMMDKTKNQSKDSKKRKITKVKGKQDSTIEVKRPSNRPDLKAMREMKETNAVLYPKRKIGDLLGVEVGYQFYSRCEMCAVGFHQHWLGGIDYIAKSRSKEDDYKSYTLPVAVCIVMSGQYEDDVDDCQKIVYTGQGGHDGLGTKRQNGDQTMERGNLALKNNMLQRLPVRVIRGHQCPSSYTGKVYTYDGLYEVVEQWAEKGNSGYTIFRYRLSRLTNQPPLTTGQVLFVRSQVPKLLSDIRGLVCEDISEGQELLPVRVTNVVDDPPIGPIGFKYIKTLQVADNIRIPSNALGCKCKGHCVDPNICSCAKLNGLDFPYVSKDGGRLVQAKSVVFECGPNCSCSANCTNKTSQQGLKYQLEIFKTPSKGWAVRSWDMIPAGAPICEYVGILTRNCDIENASNNSYIFDIDCLDKINNLNGRKECGDISFLLKDKMGVVDEPEYCIDAGSVGNVARFINHSCEPNLFVQCILSSHREFSMSRVVLFAADNIPPLQELTYDYGYALDSVVGSDGEVIKSPCYCGEASCRKRLY